MKPQMTQRGNLQFIVYLFWLNESLRLLGSNIERTTSILLLANNYFCGSACQTARSLPFERVG